MTELEFHKKWHDNFEGYFFKELKFLELKLHGKLKFHKFEFQKNSRLYITNIFSKHWYMTIFATMFKSIASVTQHEEGIDQEILLVEVVMFNHAIPVRFCKQAIKERNV